MKKYLVLISSAIVQTLLGGVFAWSIFADELNNNYGLSSTITQIVFGASILASAPVFVASGLLMRKIGARWMTFLGGLLFGGGYLIASLSNGNPALLILGAGLITGAGVGAGYIGPLTACIKWFPNKKGLITGIVVAGFGFGAIILTEFVKFLLLLDLDIMQIFKCAGGCYIILICLLGLFITDPVSSEDAPEQKLLPLSAILRDKNFRALGAAIFTASFGGILVVGSIRSIGGFLNISAETAIMGISAFAIGNGPGRILWGYIYERLGKISIPLSMLVTALATSGLMFCHDKPTMFLTLATLSGFGFGANFVLYTAVTADLFGIGRVAQVYPLVFMAYSIAGIAGPLCGGMLFDLTSSHNPALICGALISIFGIIIYKLTLGKSSNLRIET